MQLQAIVAELHEWLDTLPSEFLFLLALPFLVAAAGIMALGKETSRLARFGLPAGIGAAVAALVVTAA
jgi:hypothetical protein